MCLGGLVAGFEGLGCVWEGLQLDLRIWGVLGVSFFILVIFVTFILYNGGLEGGVE